MSKKNDYNFETIFKATGDILQVLSSKIFIDDKISKKDMFIRELKLLFTKYELSINESDNYDGQESYIGTEYILVDSDGFHITMKEIMNQINKDEKFDMASEYVRQIIFMFDHLGIEGTCQIFSQVLSKVLGDPCESKTTYDLESKTFTMTMKFK